MRIDREIGRQDYKDQEKTSEMLLILYTFNNAKTGNTKSEKLIGILNSVATIDSPRIGDQTCQYQEHN